MKPTRVEITEVPADARQKVIDGKAYLRGRTLASLLLYYKLSARIAKLRAALAALPA